MDIIIADDLSNSNPELGDLDYGVLVTDLPSGNGCVYMKVKKRTSNVVNLSWTPGCCVLLNLKYGTLRQQPASTRVTALDGKLEVCKAKNHTIYRKGGC